MIRKSEDLSKLSALKIWEIEDFFSDKIHDKEVVKGFVSVATLEKHTPVGVAGSPSAVISAPIYRLRLRVKYEIKGVPYICNKSPYEINGTHNIKAAKLLLSKLQEPGKKVDVFYDKDNPEDSIAIFKRILSWKQFEDYKKIN